jgi:GH18 family chitinase
MMRGAFRTVVLLGLLSSLAGCGGGEGGPRGAAAGGSGSGGAPGLDPTSRPSLRTVAYLPTYHGALSGWTRQMAFQNVSYVNLSFADIDMDGNVRYSDAGLPGFVATAHAAGAKVCMAMGGATTIPDGGVFATLLTDAKRPAFIENLAAFAKTYELDCLDVDLEGNGVNAFYEPFVTELSARLAVDGRELTAAVADWFGQGISDKALQSFAFVNVMAYDLYSSLKTPMQTSSVEAATHEVEKWAARLSKDRVLYGVPFYGIQWPTGDMAGKVNGQQIAYADLLRGDPTAATVDQLQGTGTVTYLNSRATIQQKAVIAKDFGGIMVWEAGQDATGEASLLKAIRDAVP